MKIELTASATEHIADAYWFYENQADGLGAYFRESILKDIRRLAVTAGAHQIHFEKYFRSLSKRFPFAIYYLVNDSVVRIHAVIDCRRDPEWIEGQLM